MTSLRRKSCTACVRSKRRCDLGLPACRRCVQRRLSCLYPWTTAPETRLHDDATSAAVEFPQRDAETPISHFDLDHFLNTTDILDLPSNDTAELRFGHIASNSSDLIPCRSNSAAISSIPRAFTPGMLSVIDALIDKHPPIPPSSLLSSLINNSPPTTPNPPRLITHDTSWDIGPTISGSQYQPRCEYAGRRFAQQAIDLARCGSACFIHHSQISETTTTTTTTTTTSISPNSISSAAIIQDALASSALFAMQNPVNAAVVRAYITQRATLLINTVNALLAHQPQTTTTTSPAIHLDLLPPVQALLIYQSIALFGRHHNTHSSPSDITILAQAQRDELHLKSWLQLLRRQLRPLQPNRDGSTSFSDSNIISDSSDALTQQQQQQHSWKTWIHSESSRRTVLYAETLISVHSFLQHGYDRGEARILPLQYTAQTALWQARTAAEWRWTWDALPRCEVRFVSMEIDMLGVREEDSDELTLIMKVLVEGIDEVENWLGGRMMLLRRWGLRD